MTPLRTLDPAALLVGVAELSAADAHLAGIVARHGPPPLWARAPGFATLVRIVLEQQVSLSSAQAAYTRLERAVGRVTPASVAAAGRTGLASAGLTRQKSGYLAALADAVLAGSFDPGALADADDEDARDTLMGLSGIGRWTADLYLVMALGRPDVWPIGDVALAAAAQRARDLPHRPSQEQLARIAEDWRPWRAVAARILWHAYLSGERPARMRATPVPAPVVSPVPA